MDGWMDGCVDGWMDGCVDGLVDGWMDKYLFQLHLLNLLSCSNENNYIILMFIKSYNHQSKQV